MREKPETEIGFRKREENLSKDGKWRSFPKVPHLLQYVSNGNYYGRIKMGGKLIRESLQTTVWTTAKIRPTDFLKTRQENRNQVEPPLFSEAVKLFQSEIERNTTIKKRSKEYRRCLNKIQKPGRNFGLFVWMQLLSMPARNGRRT